MYLDRIWHFVFNKKNKSGKEILVEWPYFIVLVQTIARLEKGDTVQLFSLWKVKWAQTCVSTDSTSIAATAVAAAVLCLCASLQHLTIMFSFIPQTLLLPGPPSLYVPLSFFISCPHFLSHMLSFSLPLCLPNPLSFSFESCKVFQSFPWWL